MIRFKKIFQIKALSLLLVGGLMSCADDNFYTENDDMNPTLSTGSGSFYLAFDFLINDSATRSGNTFESDDADKAGDADYVYGSESENEIGSSGHYAIFFDKQGKVQMIYPLSLPNEETMEPGKDDGDKVEKRYWALLTDIEKEKLPASVVVVLNGQSVYETLTKTLTVGVSTAEEVLNSVWHESLNPAAIGRNSEGLFVMSNAAYKVDNAIQVAVPITEDMYHELEDINEPKPPQITLPDNEILKIRVERMVSKFSFRISDPKAVLNPQGYYTVTPTKRDDLVSNDKLNICIGWDNRYTFTDAAGQTGSIVTDDWAPVVAKRDWQAVISSWDMNALSRNEYIFKHVDGSGYDFYPGWDNSNYYRTFWAEDPDYAQNDYPLQFRQAYNRPLTYYKTLYDGGNTNILLNYSYNDLNNKGFNRILYLPENTYDYNLINNDKLQDIFQPGDGIRQGYLDERRDLLAGTHLILPATLLVDDGTGNMVAKDYYRDPTGVYYSSIRDCLWALVRQFNYACISQEIMRFDLFDWDPSESNTGKYNVVYGVPREGKSIDYAIYFKGAPLTYERILVPGSQGYLSDAECNAILVPALMKDGDGKRFVKTGQLSIMNSNGEHLPLYYHYELGADPETHDRIDNSKYYLGTTGDNHGYGYEGIEDIDKVLSIFLEWGGWVDHYKEGRMYYAAPATISSWGTADEPQSVCGLVRNAWYRYDLTRITAPGIPVDDETQPIVPNWGGPYDGISLKVNVLDWHYVDLGNLDGFLPNN